MFARSIAAQQQLAPVQRFQRLGDPFRGCGGGAIDAAVSVDGGPDGRGSQTQSDDHEQAGDELKHEAHAITPRLSNDANSSAIPRQLQAGDEVQLGKFSRLLLGICLWTPSPASDLTEEGPFSGLGRAPQGTDAA